MPATANRLDAIATSKPTTISLDAGLDAAATLMDDHGFRHLPVVHKKRLCGMISERDLLQALGDFHGRPDHRSKFRPDIAKVSDVMSTPVVALEATASVSDAARVLASRKFGAVPIADRRGRPSAIVTETDLLALYSELTSQAERVDEFVVGRMRTELTTVSPDDPTSIAVSLFFQHQHRHLPVVADDALVGMISDRDVRRTVGESCSPEHALRQPIREVMSKAPVTAKPDFTMHEAANMMHRLKLGALPVVEGPELLGIVTVTDVLIHLAEICGGARLGGVPALRCGFHDGDATVDPIVIA